MFKRHIGVFDACAVLRDHKEVVLQPPFPISAALDQSNARRSPLEA